MTQTVNPGRPGWGHSNIHECPPWHRADDHTRTLWQAFRQWWANR